MENRGRIKALVKGHLCRKERRHTTGIDNCLVLRKPQAIYEQKYTIASPGLQELNVTDMQIH